MKYSIVLLGLAAALSLHAMDMDKVNALAEMIKSGKVTAQSAKPTPPKPEVTVPKTAASETPSISEEESVATAPAPEKSNVAATTVNTGGDEVTEESLGLRKTDLYSEDKVTPPPVKYTDAAPGTAKKFDRSYENAPPLIPHSVEGLLPITKDNNQCLGCHMPDVAPSVGATPIPPSHFTNFRPMTQLDKEGHIIKEGVAIENTSDIKIVARQEKKLYQGRFNCSQCHVPQANVKPLVKNTFTPDYRNPDEKHKSNLLDVINEGVK